MATSRAFRIQRVAMTGGSGLVPVYPPMYAKSVYVGNGSSGDLRLHTSAAGTEHLTIAAGYERAIPDSIVGFTVNEIAFWLDPDTSGTAVILWR